MSSSRRRDANPSTVKVTKKTMLHGLSSYINEPEDGHGSQGEGRGMSQIPTEKAMREKRERETGDDEESVVRVKKAKKASGMSLTGLNDPDFHNPKQSISGLERATNDRALSRIMEGFAQILTRVKEVEKILDEIIDVGDPDGRLRRGETSKVTKTNGSEKEKGGSGAMEKSGDGVTEASLNPEPLGFDQPVMPRPIRLRLKHEGCTRPWPQGYPMGSGLGVGEGPQAIYESQAKEPSKDCPHTSWPRVWKIRPVPRGFRGRRGSSG